MELLISSALLFLALNGYQQFFDTVKGSWQWVHRRVAEIVSGKPIPPGYEVHHINHNKRDNRQSNLTVIPRSVHRAIHSGSRSISRFIRRKRR